MDTKLSFHQQDCLSYPVRIQKTDIKKKQFLGMVPCSFGRKNKHLFWLSTEG